VGSDCQLILYVGRISAKKNLLGLVQAFTLINAPLARLVIAGPVSEPNYMRQLQNDVRASPRRDDILIEGPLYENDLRAALSAADLFVLPSLNENFGNAAGEAVAAGMPVLLTDTCGIASIIHQRAGLAVPLGVDNLAAGLETMLDPVKRTGLAAKRVEVQRELSWDEPLAQTERLYEAIINGRNKEQTKSIPDRVEERR
jgi:glycosyltransferase involved in cell wall biosynthesis